MTVEETGRGTGDVDLTVRRKFIADMLERNIRTTRMGIWLYSLNSGIGNFATLWRSLTNDLTCEPWETRRKRSRPMISVRFTPFGREKHSIIRVYVLKNGN